MVPRGGGGGHSPVADTLWLPAARRGASGRDAAAGGCKASRSTSVGSPQSQKALLGWRKPTHRLSNENQKGTSHREKTSAGEGTQTRAGLVGGSEACPQATGRPRPKKAVDLGRLWKWAAGPAPSDSLSRSPALPPVLRCPQLLRHPFPHTSVPPAASSPLFPLNHLLFLQDENRTVMWKTTGPSSAVSRLSWPGALRPPRCLSRRPACTDLPLLAPKLGREKGFWRL